MSLLRQKARQGGRQMKYDKQNCPKCGKSVVNLYKKYREDEPVCYWCHKKREKQFKLPS
jgi:formylmethanofuran dehydrogenase subunit E